MLFSLCITCDSYEHRSSKIEARPDNDTSLWEPCQEKLRPVNFSGIVSVYHPALDHSLCIQSFEVFESLLELLYLTRPNLGVSPELHVFDVWKAVLAHGFY